MGKKVIPRTPKERAEVRAKELTDLVWHTGTYLIVNAFLWMLDIIGGGGVDWAYWVTIGWGIGLAFHALSYFVDGSDLQARKTEEFLDEELRQEHHDT